MINFERLEKSGFSLKETGKNIYWERNGAVTPHWKETREAYVSHYVGIVISEFATAMRDCEYGPEETHDAFVWFMKGFLRYRPVPPARE